MGLPFWLLSLLCSPWMILPIYFQALWCVPWLMSVNSTLHPIPLLHHLEAYYSPSKTQFSDFQFFKELPEFTGGPNRFLFSSPKYSLSIFPPSDSNPIAELEPCLFFPRVYVAGCAMELFSLGSFIFNLIQDPQGAKPTPKIKVFLFLNWTDVTNSIIQIHLTEKLWQKLLSGKPLTQLILC